MKWQIALVRKDNNLVAQNEIIETFTKEGAIRFLDATLWLYENEHQTELFIDETNVKPYYD